MQIDTTGFDICADSVLFLLGLLYVTDISPQAVFYLYLVVALAECVVKFCVKGHFECLQSYRICMDVAMSLLLLLIAVAEYSNRGDVVNTFAVKVLILLRLFLFPRNIFAAPYFDALRDRHRVAFESAFQRAGHISFLLLVMFAMMYGFACLGMEVFGGVIVKTGASGDAIAGTAYGLSGYWPLNFNDIPSGFVTMFVLLHVNNMHVTASGFTAIKGEWSELFFAAWYCFGVLLMLNVLTAVFLNEFTSYLELLTDQPSVATADQPLVETSSTVTTKLDSVGPATTKEVDQDALADVSAETARKIEEAADAMRSAGNVRGNMPNRRRLVRNSIVRHFVPTGNYFLDSFGAPQFYCSLLSLLVSL